MTKKEVNKGGRPPKYKTAKELQDAVDEYFENPSTQTIITKDGSIEMPVLTITGLALRLGFCDRSSFYDYEKQEKFTYTIKRARALIEEEYEKLLRHNNVAGAIFALKNMGWKDTKEITTKTDREKMSEDELRVELDRVRLKNDEARASLH